MSSSFYLFAYFLKKVFVNSFNDIDKNDTVQKYANTAGYSET